MKTIFALFMFVAIFTSAQDTAIFKIRSPKKAIDTIKPIVRVYVEGMPEFVGGSQALIQYININLNYPKTLSVGIGYYAFLVNADGTISNVIIQKGVPDCPECDMEALRVLRSLPPFIPATTNNVPVPVWFQLPIRFRL